MEKMYFESEVSNTCHPLDYYINKGKEQGLKKITLIEAIPDTTSTDLVWCSHYSKINQKSECNKSCSCYSTPVKGRICKFREKLYNFTKKSR